MARLNGRDARATGGASLRDDVDAADLLAFDDLGEAGEGGDGFADDEFIHLGDVAVADGGDGFGAFAHRVDGGGLDGFLADEVAAHLLADEIEDAVADFGFAAGEAFDESVDGVGLGAGEDAIDLAGGEAHAGGEALDADAVNEGAEGLGGDVNLVGVSEWVVHWGGSVR